jgi:hypothetical protein
MHEAIEARLIGAECVRGAALGGFEMLEPFRDAGVRGLVQRRRF